MKLPEPTTLHLDLPSAPTVSSSSPVAWIAVVVPIVIAIAWYAFHRRRQARLCPDEHAFRALARRMRLRSREVRSVRAYAADVAHVSPITVLMNPALTQEALGTPHAGGLSLVG